MLRPRPSSKAGSTCLVKWYRMHITEHYSSSSIWRKKSSMGGSGWGIISSQGRLVLCMIVGTLWFLYDLRGVRRQHRWCVFHVSLEGRQRHGCNTVKKE